MHRPSCICLPRPNTSIPGHQRPLKTAMNLPQEILDEIIRHLPPCDPHSLRSFSLVAKSWTNPARRRLFHAVDVRQPRNFRSWLENISPTNVELLRSIRSLLCKIMKTFALDSPSHPTDPGDFLRDYSPSLHRLRLLSLSSGLLLSFGQIGTPSPFRHSLTVLILSCCGVTIGVLVALVNYFSNLAHLELFDVRNEVADQPPPHFSRPLQELSVANFDPAHGLSFFEELSALDLQCDKVTLRSSSRCPSLGQYVVDCVGANVKHVYILCDLKCACDPRVRARVTQRNTAILLQMLGIR